MGNGQCNKCKCNNCDNGVNNMNDDNMDKNVEIINNDSYVSFHNEINKVNSKENKDNKTAQIPKNIENENYTSNNNQDNTTDNKKDKVENENNNSINNNDKNETANNININNNDKDNKNEKDSLKVYKDNSNDEGEQLKQENNIHIVNINNEHFQKSKNITAINEIKEKIRQKEDLNKAKPKINKTRNNIEEFDIINNDLVYITNKNVNLDDNIEYNNYSNENNKINNNKENYKYNYDNDTNNYNNDFQNNNNISNNEKKDIFDIKGIIDIFSIIPKNKLLKLKDNSIICNSILEKIIKIPDNNKIVYNERFCILTKKYFSYYKSKESYLNLSRPMLSISLKNILKVEQTILDDTSYYFGLICAINDDTKKFIDKINTFINIGENNSEEFLLGFRSKNKDLIIKWIVILNYFIENYE